MSSAWCRPKSCTTWTCRPSSSFGRGVADSVPRERRRQPGPHGLEHAAPGGAAAPAGSAAGRHRHGARGGPRLGRGHRRQAGRGRRVRRGRPRGGAGRGAVEEGRPGTGPAARHLQPDQVPAVEPEHVPEPEADREEGAACPAGRHHRRRPGHRSGRARARAQRARRLHAVGRLQLRGRDPGLRAAREGRPVHVDPHRGVRDPGAGHEARQGRDHPRHSQCLRGSAEGPRRVGHRPHRREGQAGRYPGRQDHAEGRDAAHAGREAPAGHLRREGRRRARHVPDGARRGSRAPWST